MIKVENLSFSYKDRVPVLHDFSLEVDKGSLFGLLGPNGAGKTTLISMISGLRKPDSGSLSINGKTYQEHRNTILAELALVPQDYAFYPQLTAYENLSFFLSLYRTQVREPLGIDRAIELTGLGDYQHRKAATFSGGLKRRLNLAIGLLHNPSLLILDEPTVGIDPQSRAFILNAIKEINREGVTVIYTSHYMDEVEKICNKLAIMDRGKILRMGTISELLSNDTPLRISIKGAFQLESCSVPLQRFVEENSIECDANCLSTNDISDKLCTDLIQLLKENSLEVSEIHYGKKSLESLFFSLTHTHLRDE